MIWGWSRFYFVLSVFALVIVGVLLCLVMWMTRAIIGETKVKKIRFEFLNPGNLKLGAAEAPFLTLIFFHNSILGSRPLWVLVRFSRQGTVVCRSGAFEPRRTRSGNGERHGIGVSNVIVTFFCTHSDEDRNPDI
jgi:hypothetical protein